MKFLVMFIVLLLSGCIVVHDKSNAPIAKNVVGSFYQTAKNGYLYEARCADVNASVQSTEWCTGIQAFDSGNENFKTPINYKEYLASKEEWDKKLFTTLAFEKQRSIISPLPKGSIVKVTKLVQYPWGSNGYYWAIRGSLDFDGKKIEVELPTNSVFAFPTWLNGYGVQKAPQFKAEYLIRCSAKKCT
ncbi:hypothetical protein [Cognaticolwellia aestuarii]|uniref:hypothetical protein n=1 Tax=Cognaticolwellia aestuarii TaxID=329993 RepID=UPI000987C93B|nr:hypothetical protein [Cognaticolwellia aestuarii]